MDGIRIERAACGDGTVELRAVLPRGGIDFAGAGLARGVGLIWFALEPVLEAELSPSARLRVMLAPDAGAMDEALAGRLLRALGGTLRRAGTADRCAALSLGVAAWAARQAAAPHAVTDPVPSHMALIDLAAPLWARMAAMARLAGVPDAGRDALAAHVAAMAVESETEGEEREATVLALALWLGDALVDEGFRWVTVRDERGEEIALARPVPGSATAEQLVYPFSVVRKRLARGEAFDPRRLVERLAAPAGGAAAPAQRSSW
jgi:hypothetical protein